MKALKLNKNWVTLLKRNLKRNWRLLPKPKVNKNHNLSNHVGRVTIHHDDKVKLKTKTQVSNQIRKIRK